MTSPAPASCRLLLFTRGEGEILQRLAPWLEQYRRVVPNFDVLILTAEDVPARNADNSPFTGAATPSASASPKTAGADRGGQEKQNPSLNSISAKPNALVEVGAGPAASSSSSRRPSLVEGGHAGGAVGSCTAAGVARSVDVPPDDRFGVLGRGGVEELPAAIIKEQLTISVGDTSDREDGAGEHREPFQPLSRASTFSPTNSLSTSLWTRQFRGGSRNEIHRRAEAFRPHFIVSVLYPKKIHTEVLSLVPNGLAVNLHPSLLPKHRGSLCQFWPIFEGDPESGVTVHQMETFDNGPVYFQKSCAIDPLLETAVSLNRKILILLEECFDWTLKLFFAEELAAAVLGGVVGTGKARTRSLASTAGQAAAVAIDGAAAAPCPEVEGLLLREKVARIQSQRETSKKKDSGEANNEHTTDTYYPYHYKKFPFDGVVQPELWDRGKIDRFIRAMYFPPKPPARLKIKNLDEFEFVFVHSMEEYDDAVSSCT